VKGTLLFNALREAIDEEMDRDPLVCVMGEDVGQYGGSYKVTKDLYEKYGEFRVLDTPIAENSFTGMAVGAAMTGLRPIVEGMNMGFLLLAFNQISNNMGMLRYTSGGNFTIPTVVRGPGGVGRQLGAEHSQRLEAYFHAVPGINIVACSTPTNAKGLMKAAIRDNNPVLFFEHVLLYNLTEDLPEGDYVCALDQADLVKQGSDITILTYSRMRHHCLKAVELLEGKGIDVELIDLISLKPFVMETISKGAAQSWQMENRYRTMTDDKFDYGFAVDWMRKDLKIAMDEAKNNGSLLPVTELIDKFYGEVQGLGGNRWDTSSLIKRFRK